MTRLNLSRSTAAGFLLATLACHSVPEAAADPIPTVIAVGDLHADLPQALAALRLAGVVDDQGRWSAGSTVFVQTGDTTDRGPDSKEVIELLQRLDGEARAAGGRVVALLGNHELMNLQGDWRYVTAGDVQDFGTVQARRIAFSADGDIGRWLRERDVVALVGDTVFVHGGVTPELAVLGIPAINEHFNEALNNMVAGPPADPLLGTTGPVWFRGYLLDPNSCAALDQALQFLGARRMVVGHTTQAEGRVATRCDGRLIGIDTGISSYYGGHLAAIRIEHGDAWALYPDGPVDLVDPAEPARPLSGGTGE